MDDDRASVLALLARLFFEKTWGGLKLLSHNFLYNRKSAIVARASVTCSTGVRHTRPLSDEK